MIVCMGVNVNVSHLTKFSCNPKGKQVSWNEIY